MSDLLKEPIGTPARVFSAGDCPVCPGFGAVHFVKSISSGQVFLLCPYCGVAWTAVPRPKVVDKVLTSEELAPGGINLPSRSEIVSAGFAGLIKAEHFYADWSSALERFLLDAKSDMPHP